MSERDRGPLASQRAQAFSKLASHTFDLLVVGGGIVGCGVARDAALRGLSVALVDQQDFGAGTSSRSTKLVHGGVRYLEHGQFALVFESVNERAVLLKLAPHLVRPLPFLFPAFRGSRRGLFTLDVGLWLYDALSGFSSHRLHRTHRAAAVRALEPGLRTEGLKGGVVYYDCLTDDFRLTLENALDARALGATVLSRTKVTSLEQDAQGRVTGARVEDTLAPATAAPVRVAAKVVVNATGVWSDQLRAMLGQAPVLRPTKGVHLVVESSRLPLRHAVVMFAKRDQRVMFAIPWDRHTVLGTTDTDYQGDPNQVHATHDDAEYILETANLYFPQHPLGMADVVSTWAGLRPLVSPPDEMKDASSVSREHVLEKSPGLVTLAGGKLTTYRRIAEQVVDAAAEQLGVRRRCTTDDRPLPGAQAMAGGVPGVVAALVRDGVPEPQATHLAWAYGARALEVSRRARARPDGLSTLCSDAPHLWAQVDEAVEHEAALSVTDVLARRVPLLLQSRTQGLEVVEAVARRMAGPLGWDEAQVRHQVAAYQGEVESSRRFRHEG